MGKVDVKGCRTSPRGLIPRYHWPRAPRAESDIIATGRELKLSPLTASRSSTLRELSDPAACRRWSPRHPRTSVVVTCLSGTTGMVVSPVKRASACAGPGGAVQPIHSHQRLDPDWTGAGVHLNFSASRENPGVNTDSRT